MHDKPGGSYNVNKQTKLKILMLRSNLCDHSDAYIVAEGTITIRKGDNAAYDNKLAFKNHAPFIGCISKINNTLIDNTEDLDIVMPMYNSIDYSKSYLKTSGSLRNYYRDEPNSGLGGDYSKIDYSIKDQNLSILKQVLQEN